MTSRAQFFCGLAAIALLHAAALALILSPTCPERAAHAPAQAGATAASKIGVHSGAAAREGVALISGRAGVRGRFTGSGEIKTPARGFLAGAARRENF